MQALYGIKRDYALVKKARRQREGNAKATRRQREGNAKATRRQREGNAKATPELNICKSSDNELLDESLPQQLLSFI